MRRPSTLGVLLLVAAPLCLADASAQSPPLNTLLDRATAYGVELIQRLSNVVAEEHYVQQMGQPHNKRTLRSDFLLVSVPGLSAWTAFRDVFEVDGRPVRGADQQDRLARLFLDPPRDALQRAEEISNSSARHNLADIGTLNNPLLALGFIQANYRPRFRFTRAGLAKNLGPDVRTVRFEEWQRPTILKNGPNDDLPARGLLWIEEGTGRVVKTELEVGPAYPATEIVTTFKLDPELQLNVPVEMREFYPVYGQIRSVATYGRFRRFQVRTEETIRP